MSLGAVDDDVGRDAAAAGYLAAAIGLANLRRMIGNFALVVIFVKGDGFVIALDEAAAGSVVTRGGESEAGVFREGLDRLHEALAEGGFANDQAAIVILNGAGDDFGGGSGVVVDEDDEGNGHALIAANGVEAALRSAAAVIGNDELTLFEEHVANGDGFIEKAAGIAAHVEDEAVEGIGTELLEGVGNFAVGGFVELGEANVADAGLEHGKRCPRSGEEFRRG